MTEKDIKELLLRGERLMLERMEACRVERTCSGG